MRHQLAAYIDNSISTILIFTIGILPLVILNYTTEFYEMPKLAFLVVITMVLIVLWCLSWVVKGKVVLVRTPIDLPLLLLLIIVVLSTVFSPSQYPAIFGNFPKVHSSAISLTTYILFYFVLVSNLKGEHQIKSLLYVLIGSSMVVTVLSILAFLGIYLPFSATKFANFSPAGSSFSAVALALLMLPMTLLATVHTKDYLTKTLGALGASIFGLTVLFLGILPLYLVGVLAVGLIFFITKPDQVKRSFPFIVTPIIIILLAALISYLPVNKNQNLLYQKMQNFPREIQLSFGHSWKIAASSFTDRPFLGSGPATFLFDFAQYKPLDYNLTRFWNFRFDTAFNEFLQTLATLGVLGFLALIYLSFVVLVFAWNSLTFSSQELEDTPAHAWHKLLSQSLAVSAITAVFLLGAHVTTLVSILITLVIFALLMVTNKHVRGKVQELSIGIKASSISDSNLIVGDALPIIIFIPIVVLAILGLWNTFVVVQADHMHRIALNFASQPGKGKETYDALIEAEKLNPKIDLYRLDLAQTNFALANNLAQAKGPTEASPGGSLTDDDKRTIQILLSQAVNEGRAATALSPQNPLNWEVMASIYRNITGVAQNALAFALDSYGRAIQRDPFNPLLRLNVGGVYYAAKNYDLAIRFFSDTVNLKPDFANGFYNLSVALRDKGDLQGAQAAAEQVVKILSSNTQSPDYKTAANYLTDLKARIATGSAQQQGNIPPAAQQNGALQNQNLPKLPVDLQQKENVATPEAIKKNPKAQLPTPSPVVSPVGSPSPANP